MLDHAAGYHEIVDTLAANMTVTAGMRRLVEFCNAQFAAPSWLQIADLDYDVDRAHLERWLRKLLTNEPPPFAIVAYWFGIFNPVYAGKTVSDLYVAGSDRFDSTDSEWAVNPSYFPSGRYSHSRIHANIYRITRRLPDEAFMLGEYVLCLGYSALVVRQLTQVLPRRLLLGLRTGRDVVVGFDSGDAIRIGALTQGPLTPRASG
jgi:hypothetical protein